LNSFRVTVNIKDIFVTNKKILQKRNAALKSYVQFDRVIVQSCVDSLIRMNSELSLKDQGFRSI